MTAARSRLIAYAVCVLALAAAVLAPAAAGASPRLAVTVQQSNGEPGSYLIVSSQAGKHAAAGTIAIRNEDDRPVTVNVDPVSAETAANLGSAYALRNQPLRASALWLHTSLRRLSLAPGESAEVGVSADVPDGQADGEYLAGISIQAQGQGEQSARGGEVAVASTQRYVVGVQVDVGDGRQPRLVFTGAAVERQPAGVTFLVKMRNTGNVILQNVQGRIEVERDGRRVASAPIGPGTFVTGTGIEFPLLVRREDPAEGTEYRVRAVARYEGREARLDETVTFGHEAAERQGQYGGRGVESGFPWLWVAIGAAALLALLLAATYFRRRRGRPLPAWEETVALIDRELAQPAAGPLTAIAIGPLPTDPELRQNLVLALTGRMRVIDVLTEPEPGTVVILAPNTSESAAIALLEDAERLVGYVGGETAVASYTALPTEEANEVLHALLAQVTIGA
jgi:hypothetical protein